MASDFRQAQFAGVKTNNWAAFAEPTSRLSNVEIHGTIFFGFGSYINSGVIRSWVEVGRYSSIGRDVSLGLGHHNMAWFSTSPFFEQFLPTAPMPLAQENPKRRCVIGNDCWIGDKVMIVSGVTIGSGSICAAGATVVRDVEPFEIVGGVPAKHLGWRFDAATRERLQKLAWWNYDPKLLQKLAKPDIGDFLDSCEAVLTAADVYPPNFRRFVGENSPRR